MLEVRDLWIDLGRFALGPLSLAVSSGEYAVLLGPSGSGKTTLLECIAGFRDVDAGTVRIDGEEVIELPPRRRGLGVVYQDADLFPHLDVRGNIAFPLRMRGASEERRGRRVAELARLLRVEHCLDSSPAQLSGGEARRVALGRALAADQRVLLMDEPLEGLDPYLRRELRHELATLHAGLGLTVLHITHHLQEARSLATRLAILLDGRLAQEGPPDEVFARPASAAVARFLMVPNFLEGEARDGGMLRLSDHLAVPAPVAAGQRVRARVGGLRLAPEAEAEGCAPATVRGFDRGRTGRVSAIVRLRDGDADGPGLEVDLDETAEAPAIGQECRIDFRHAEWELF